jgi:serine/threonine protein kinase
MASAQQFGKYSLQERIAVGGMAEIYRAKTFGAAGFEKDLVLKRILPQFSSDDDFVRMFIDEARIAAKLQHPNIVQIFDFDCAQMADGDSYYIAMELVEGRDLRHLLKEGVRKNLPLTIPQCVHIAIEALKGLHYAHTKSDSDHRPLNIVHRDVSPHNILVSHTGDVKISDFGIAKAAARASATSNGMVKGKLAYMSPEQVTGQSLDRRTDVFSMGICIYEMLTRTRLFVADSETETINRVRVSIS